MVHLRVMLVMSFAPLCRLLLLRARLAVGLVLLVAGLGQAVAQGIKEVATTPDLQGASPPNACDQAMERASRLGLASEDPGTTPDTPLKFPWRLSEHTISFLTDEFDGAQMSSAITSLVQGRGQYNIRLTLPPQYEHFTMASSGATQVEDCTPGGPTVSCKINNTGKPVASTWSFSFPQSQAHIRRMHGSRTALKHFIFSLGRERF